MFRPRTGCGASLFIALLGGSGLGTIAGPGATHLAAQVAGSGGQPELVDVRFEGNEVFPDDSLRFAIVNRRTVCRTFIFQILPPLCPFGVDFAIERNYYVPREVSPDSARIAAFYFSRGYREVVVDTSFVLVPGSEGAKGVLSFGLAEGRPVLVDSMAILGIENLPADIADRLPLGPGLPLSNVLLQATRDTIEIRLRNQGFARAEALISLFIPSDRPYEAEVEYSVATGPRMSFGPIVFRRDSTTAVLSETTLRRMIPFQEGDVYSRALVDQALRNVVSLEVVRNARIDENLDFEVDTLVPLVVEVAEGEVHRVRAGVGWSTAECLNTEATWASRNFLGAARRLQFRGRLSNVLARDFQESGCPQSGVGEFADINWLVSAELFQPWFFSTRNALTLSVFAERQSLPDVFVRKAVGVTASVARTLGPTTLLSLAFRPQLTSLDAAGIFFCTSFLVCTPSDISILESANWLSPVAATITQTRTNDLLNPSDGYTLLLDLEHASSLSGSDFAYNRIIAEANWYQELARRTVWAAKARIGWVGAGDFGGLSLGGLGVIHPQKRFYAGGANSVRGFAQNRLGPRVLTVDVEDLVGFVETERDGETTIEQACTPGEVMSLACDASPLNDGFFFPRPQGGTRLVEGSLEYRFAFGGAFQAVLFTDAGQVWSEGETLGLGDLEFSPGVGVRYFSPIGPIRVDVGYRFRRGEELQVVTSQLRIFDPSIDRVEDRLVVAGPDLVPEPIPWVKLQDLALLDRRVLFGESGGFFRNLQLHFSIGQAF